MQPIEADCDSSGRTANTVWNTIKSITLGYVVPPEVYRWTPKSIENWVTPVVPPNVSLERWNPIDPIKLAYVKEYNWERQGVRGFFAISHCGRGNAGAEFVIGSLISPSLYTQLGAAIGQSGQRYIIVGRNTYWASAVIGAFENDPYSSDGGTFVVHYNDDGNLYRVIRLPYVDFLNYIRTVVDSKIRSYMTPTGQFVSATLEESVQEPPLPPPRADLLGDNQSLSPPLPPPRMDLLGDNQPLSPSNPPVAGSTHDAPLINETFIDINMERFWPQFMTALEIALFSPVKSMDLFAQLQRKQYWTAVQVYMSKNRNNWAWVPPTYSSSFGKYTQPNYLT